MPRGMASSVAARLFQHGRPLYRPFRPIAGAIAVGLSLTIGVPAAGPAWASISIGAPPEPASTRSVAVRHGVMAIPLKTPPEGQGLPSVATVRVVSGDSTVEVEGRVVWLAEPGPSRERRWTTASNPMVVRTLADGDDPRILLQPLADPAAPPPVIRVNGALLLVELPAIEGEATIELNGTTLQTAWLEPAPPPAIDPERGASWRDDAPDPISPFEWFRWVLIAEAKGEPAPAPPGDAASQLMARHVADLWRAGIARVERQSRGVADAVRRWLTATCRDGSHATGPEVGAWLAEPGELASLLALLLDTSRSDDTIMRAVLAWMDARTPLILWVESDVGGVVGLAVANPLDEEAVLQVAWLGETEPPVAALVEPHRVGRVRIERPKRPTTRAAGLGEEPEPLLLLVQCKRFSKRIALSPGAVMTRPPGLQFGSFFPVMTLAEAESGRVAQVPNEWTTNATLRRRAGAWEIFIEAFAPAGTPRAEDGVRLRAGGHECFVHADGRVEAGAELVEASIKDFPDRWRARVVIPADWLPQLGETMPFRIGMRRELGAFRATAVMPLPAIDPSMPEVEVDLASWQDIVPAGDELPEPQPGR